ncbi:hypothetical protein D3C79_963110 [compost metagenome]
MRRDADAKSGHMAAPWIRLDLEGQIANNDIVDAGDQPPLSKFDHQTFLPHFQRGMR